jgi:hypothetical protein
LMLVTLVETPEKVLEYMPMVEITLLNRNGRLSMLTKLLKSKLKV